MEKKKNDLNLIFFGIIDNNPTLVQLLGMCSTMAVSTSLENGIGMGLATTAVLAGSNVVISLLRKLIPQRIRIAAYVVIIAGFVTIIDLLMQGYLPQLTKELGIFIPLIVVNCIILARAEAFASKNNVWRSFLDGIGMGLGFTLALSAMAVVREVLGSGALYGYELFGDSFEPVAILRLPPGGFITLGLLIAGVQKLKSRGKEDA
ncbi:MAG: electron transport complex subunit E [Clostridiales bacterium]|jgi:electron transport complex protein RnfE|nr:electron transport complex subunit E [Clostridiales bacterium]